MMNSKLLKVFYQCKIISFILICFLTGCNLTESVNNGGSSGAPIACLEQVVQSRYKSWEENNTQDIRKLEEISLQKDWHLITASDRTIKEIDLHNSECRIIYTSKNNIRYADIQKDGKILLIETKHDFRKGGSTNFVILYGKDSGSITIKLNNGNILGNYLGGNPILANSEYIIFPDGNDVMMQDMVSGKQRMLLKGKNGAMLLTINESAERFFLVMTTPLREPAKSEMVILNSKHHLERKIPNVTNSAVCGDKILIEQNGRICEYNPIKNVSKPLINGALLAVIDNHTFLFADSSWKAQKDGWLRLEYSVWEYNLSRNSSRKVAGKFSIDTCYGVTYPVISPDKEYVIISDNTESALLDSEYLVYRIDSGEKICSFYEPYLGKYYFTHILAWLDESNQTTLNEIKGLGTD